MIDIARFSKPEWKYVAVGMLGSCVQGFASPVGAFVASVLAGSFAESMLCAGGQEGVDACNDDSGGPLTITDS